MPRPFSDSKRQAIMTCAIQAIAAEGIGTPTARIASAAGIAEGTLFTYFRTKDILINELYAVLKREVTAAILRDYPETAARPAQLSHVWRAYIEWGLANPERHQALKQLTLSGRLTVDTLAGTNEPLSAISDLLANLTAHNRELPLSYATAVMGALADATIDVVLTDPTARDRIVAGGESGLRRFLCGP